MHLLQTSRGSDIMSLQDATDPQPREGPVEQYAKLADLLTERPKLAGKLLLIAEMLAIAEDMRWTGRLQINLQTGEVMGGPVIK